MTTLKSIWIEKCPTSGDQVAVRVDWNNDRHQRVEILRPTPEAVQFALDRMVRLIRSEIESGKL